MTQRQHTRGLGADLVRIIGRAAVDHPIVLRQRPTPRFVLKFRDQTYRKLFVNVCILNDFDGVVEALDWTEDTEGADHGSPHPRMLVSKTSTSSLDRRNEPCVVFQCGCPADLVDRIHAEDGAAEEREFMKCLVEALWARGWQVVGEATRPRMRCKGEVPDIGQWGYTVRTWEGVHDQVVVGDEEDIEVPFVKVRLEDDGRGDDPVDDMELAERHTVRYSSHGGGPKGLRKGFLL